ncbi:Hypothetical protein CINCED_3A002940 [Cinara cedri]|uniref:Uncharacterized protein n=1 Tax=Cinara cedri TaxID=506608 RepID=A0A5E4N4X7_9HEMI|nr:Hypothetical protein CINCED_3A002940 [Cinara cedri]
MSGCSSDSDSVGAVQRNERLLRTNKRMSRKRALVSSDDDDAPRTKRVASPVPEGVSAIAGDREKWLGLGRDIRKRKLERMFEDLLHGLCIMKKLSSSPRQEFVDILDRYVELMDEVLRENAGLEGSLSEARRAGLS